MAKKKKKSKLKKILGAVGKAALLDGAAFGASKLFGGAQKRKANLASSYANVKDRHVPYDSAAIAKGVLSQQHDSESDMYTPKKWYQKIFKKGGRVTKRGVGIAKRGYGRALKGKR